MEYNIFKAGPPPVFTLDSIGPSGVAKGVIRVRDDWSRVFDFTVDSTNAMLLPYIDSQLTQNSDPTTYINSIYDIVIKENDYFGAIVRPDPLTNIYPEVGYSNNQVIHCTILARGISAPPVNGQMTHFTNGGAQTIPLVWDTRKVFNQSNSSIDYTDSQVQMNASALTAHISSDGNGSMSIGAGATGLSLDPKNGLTHSVTAITHATQEESHGGGMFTTSLNFLQHYFIGLGNAVALPMPHVPNILKMIAIGKFVKNIIGSKSANTGIYGLVNQIDNIAK